MSSISNLLAANKEWAAESVSKNPDFFSKWANTQAPEYLFIGCADSRVPTNLVMKMAPGDCFVQRNVGNLVNVKDLNCMCCLEYAVDHLKVSHVLVCGHYNCGACKAGLLWKPDEGVGGVTNLWIADVKAVREAHADMLKGLPLAEAWLRLCELNVLRQVYNACLTPTVQGAWKRGQPLAVHGLIYDPTSGHITELTSPITGMGMEPTDEVTRNILKKVKAHVGFGGELH